MPQTDALLRPIPRDALLTARPAYVPPPPAPAADEPLEAEPAPPAPEIPEIPEADILPDLLAAFDAPDADEEADDGPDAVDSADMPTPACVPLFDFAVQQKPKKQFNWAVLPGALLVLAGLALWWLAMRP